VNQFDFKKGELLLIDKPKNWTSFDIVRKIRNTTNAKIGHAGTLDPLATGLLIVGTGVFTKQLTELQTYSKEYTGSFYIGATTPSYDLETEPNETWDISAISENDIYKAVESFKGESMQMPPIFSAIKIGGKTSYDLARKGQTPDLQSRPIIIYDFEITKIELPEVYFRVACSKGTYIRSLAYDFGRALGVGAYMSSLCRTKIGEYKLEDAWQMEALITEIKRQQVEAAAI